jgi:hypothetical protein
MRRVQRSVQRSNFQKVALLGMRLALWVSVSFVFSRLLQSTIFGGRTQLGGFEQAFQTVVELGSTVPGYVPSPVGRAVYGIPQHIYDGWRIEQRQPPQPIDAISLDEARAIYQKYWNGGNCDRYSAPLDMACLDSVIGFGIEQGSSFLVNLPSDAQTAALEVVRRREEFRHQVFGNYAYVGNGQQLLMEGIKRDQALAGLVQSYPFSEQTELSTNLRRWLGFNSPKPNESIPNQPSTSPDLSPNLSPNLSPTPAIEPPRLPTTTATASLSADEIYTQAKPFTVEVWIETNGIPAPAAGIILSSDGLVLTNQHVVGDSVFQFVRLADGRDLSGTIVDINPSLDLALIQLDQANHLPVATFAQTSSHLKLGDTVYAIGSPTGTHWQMTTAELIQVQSDCGLINVSCLRTPKGFLKPGNSGGPLLDSFGQVVGVNRAIQQRTGEGVSIPVEVIQEYVEQRRD